MKRRFIPIIPITVGLILITGLAYALEKKKQAKPADLTPETMTEEEALKAELLDATEGHQNKRPGTDDANLKKSFDGRSNPIQDKLKSKPRTKQAA